MDLNLRVSHTLKHAGFHIRPHLSPLKTQVKNHLPVSTVWAEASALGALLTCALCWTSSHVEEQTRPELLHWKPPTRWPHTWIFSLIHQLSLLAVCLSLLEVQTCLPMSLFLWSIRPLALRSCCSQCSVSADLAGQRDAGVGLGRGTGQLCSASGVGSVTDPEHFHRQCSLSALSLLSLSSSCQFP